MIDLSLIQTFIEVARSGNLVGAAQNLYLTQSAVSQRIKQLEGILKQSLFNRKKTGMELNARGHELLTISADLRQGFEQVEGWVMQQNNQFVGHILIATVSGPVSYIFPKFLKIFLKRYPEIKITITVLVSSEIEEQVLSAQADIGIIVSNCQKQSLKTQKLGENTVLMVCAPTYFLAKKKQLSTADIKSARIIWHANKKSRTVRAIAGQLAISLNAPHIYLSDMQACKDHALQGLGVAFVAKTYLTQELKKRTLIALPGFSMKRPYYLISRNDKYQLPIVTAFKKDFVAYCHQNI